MEVMQSIAAAEGIVVLLDDHPVLMRDQDLREVYAFHLNHLIVSYIDQKRLDKAGRLMGRFEALITEKAGGMQANVGLYAHYAYASLWLAISSKDWAACKSKADMAFKEFVQQENFKGLTIWPAVVLMGAYSAFLARDFGLCRRFIRQFRTHFAAYKLKSLTFVWAGGVFLLTYLEEQDSFLGRATKDIEAFFREVGCVGPYETTLLSFFRKVSEGDAVDVTFDALEELRNSLNAIFHHPEGMMHKDAFPILEWIDAHQASGDIRDFLKV
jgi:hypothetical protein